MMKPPPSVLVPFTVLVLLTGLPAVTLAADAPRPPNLIILLADDLGYGETSMQGGDIATPNIDRFASSGVRFTQAYVSCSVCSPSRAGLLTGRYQERFGYEHNPPPPQSAPAHFGLPRSETPLSERLHAAGYATGALGKWHLGYREGLRPWERGFDEFYGFLGGEHPYLGDGKSDSLNHLRRGAEPVNEKEYLTYGLAREAENFIARHREQPFFLYLAFNAVHTPLQPPPGEDPRWSKIAEPKRRAFAGMLVAMDDAIGRVLAAVHKHGLDERTLIIFLSDNGGPTGVTTASNRPLRGGKGSQWEGGIRIPFAAAWPGHIPGGRVSAAPIIALDLAPTFLAAAGVPARDADRIEGRNLIPLLTGKDEQRPHEALFWRMSPNYAARVGDWKLVHMNNEIHLFNLAADPGEKNELSSQQPEKLKELRAAYEKWNSNNQPPAW